VASLRTTCYTINEVAAPELRRIRIECGTHRGTVPQSVREHQARLTELGRTARRSCEETSGPRLTSPSWLGIGCLASRCGTRNENARGDSRGEGYARERTRNDSGDHPAPRCRRTFVPTRVRPRSDELPMYARDCRPGGVLLRRPPGRSPMTTLSRNS